MLVYGDARRREDPRDTLARLSDALRRTGAMPPGIVRHGELVAALIEAGELAQGIADADAALDGEDRITSGGAHAMEFATRVAAGVIESWDSGFAELAPDWEAALATLSGAQLPTTIEKRLPEGYVFYALYPETYAQAARALPREARISVVGIRSIGTSLAAMVAAATGAPAPVTLRPVGHPFRRAVAAEQALSQAVCGGSETHVAIVDEGPGLSGSTFGSVADWLVRQGVSEERLHLFPSHGGAPGSHADPAWQARWPHLSRHVVETDALVLRSGRPEHRLENWAAELVGPALEPLQEISGGAWRRCFDADEERWPPAQTQTEKRKFLMRTESGAWLLKFVGLGRYGAAKYERARLLAEASFTAQPAGFRHGFLVERWHEEASPLDMRTADRASLIEHLGRYLGFRARHFGSHARSGATLDELFVMTRVNAGELLGENAARRVERLATAAASRGCRIHRIETDNRLQRWEWLRLPSGALLKTDALDHHAGHDLVGCQDVAWDIAGSAVEFNLSDSELTMLCSIAEASGARMVDPSFVDVLQPCYLAFQAASFRMAAAAQGYANETKRLDMQSSDYLARLSLLLG